ncbi:MAG: DUF3874 domain-containing protein [Bacteroidaceae bacterium]|nr:DUF3874 domain-containing protein [Bacteroidaceae bacterium]
MTQTILQPTATNPTQATNIMQQLIDSLTECYEFRHNVIMGYAETRPKNDPDASWSPVTEQVLNTMTIKLLKSGLNVWDRDVRRFINSTDLPDFNPVADYLSSVAGRWDGQDHIRALARTVPTDVPRRWPAWFHRWFLAMVAQWQGRDHSFGNAIVPLLISEQGMHKSTFCRLLLPEPLRSWGYTDNCTLADERQIHLMMSQMLLINLDEFNRISPQKQSGLLKNIVQLPSVKVRRPYSSHTEEIPRLASFIATTNMSRILADPTGSRRFIGVQITGPIHIPRSINHEQLYAQALAELDHGIRYWFTDTETKSIMQHNRKYHITSDAEGFFLEHFELTTDETLGQWMSAASIIESLHKKARGSFRAPTVYMMGRTLSCLPGIVRQHTHYGERYLVRAK